MNTTVLSPIIRKNGQLLKVYFPQKPLDCNPQSSQFHSQWLWSNDPINFSTPSGQKKQYPGSYPGLLLQTATILHRGKDDITALDLKLPPKPRHGGVHPFHTSAVVKEEENKDRGSTRVEEKGEESISHTSEEDSLVLYLEWTNGTKTFFDLEWLRQWAYDETSLAKGRLIREVTPNHTFIKKMTDSEGMSSIFKKESKMRLSHHKGLKHIEFLGIGDKYEEFNLLNVSCQS